MLTASGITPNRSEAGFHLPGNRDVSVSQDSAAEQVLAGERRLALPVLPLEEAPAGERDSPSGSVTVSVDVPLACGRLRADVPVTPGKTTPAGLLPVFQSVADA